MDTPTEKRYTEEEKRDILYAVEYAAKAAARSWASEVDSDVSRAIKYLTEFMNNSYPVPAFDERTAEVSSAIHTYLRKGCDCSLTTLLYILFSRSEGVGVWHALCAAVVKNYENKKQDAHFYRRAIEIYYREHTDVPGNDTMYFALDTWLERDDGKEFLAMLKTFKNGGWV
jgi:hypothetical protein